MTEVYARSTVHLPDWPLGQFRFVDDADPNVQQYFAADLIVATDYVPVSVSPWDALGGELEGTVADARIVEGVVTTAKMPDNAVTGPKIAPLSIDQTKIAPSGDVGDVLTHVSGGGAEFRPPTGGGGGGTPDPHAESHEDGGSDELALAISQITGLQTAIDGKASTNHVHSLDDMSDVNLSGQTDGKVLGRSGGVWVPVAGGGGAVTLDDLTDVDVAGASDGDYLARVAGEWVSVTPPGGATALDELNDVNAPSPGEGDYLSRVGAEWVPVPAPTGALAIFVTPEAHGATGNAKVTGTGFSATSGTRRITFASAGFVNGDAGKFLVAPIGVGGTEKIVKLSTGGRVSSTQWDCENTNGTTTNVVEANASSDGAAFGSDDGAALQAAVTAAKANKLPVALGAGKRYLTSISVDCTNWDGGRIIGLGGQGWVNDSGVMESGGSFILPMGASAVTAINALNTVAQHSGVMLERVCFHQPTQLQTHRGVHIGYQTRWKLRFVNTFHLDIGVQWTSGQKDVSWGDAISIHSAWCKTNWKSFNAQEDGSGAMAIRIGYFSLNCRAGETGYDHGGGQYWEFGPGKMDLDGAGVVGIRLRDQTAFSAAASRGYIYGVGVEFTKNQANANSKIIEIGYGVGSVQIVGLRAGGLGGGASAAGIGIDCKGGTGGYCEDITISDSIIQHCSPNIRIDKGRQIIIDKVQLTGAGLAFQATANATNVLMRACRFDTASNPVGNASLIDVNASASMIFFEDVMWNGGRSKLARWAGQPSSWFGAEGDIAYRNDTDTLTVRTAAGWPA